MDGFFDDPADVLPLKGYSNFEATEDYTTWSTSSTLQLSTNYKAVYSATTATFDVTLEVPFMISYDTVYDPWFLCYNTTSVMT
jgi:hypothetical protein